MHMGNPLPAKRIQVDGAPFSVRENLYSALQTLQYEDAMLPLSAFNRTALKIRNSLLRRSKGKLYYWIDQICIDQNNIAERNSQIRLKTDIYGRATKVFTWLGETILEDEELAAANHLTRPDLFVATKDATSAALRDLKLRVDGLHSICRRSY